MPSLPGLPPINYDNPHLYEHLTLIIDQFEKAALRSTDRQAILATAQSPLNAMDQILSSSDKALTMGRTANAKRVSAPASNQRSASGQGGTADGWEAPGFRLEGSGLSDDSSDEQESWSDSHNDLAWIASGEDRPDRPDTEQGEIPDISQPSFKVGTEGSVGFDADFNELLNGDPGNAQIGDWLKDCLGCDLRINFDWQLQPIDLLSPLAGLLGDINAALDQFEHWFNPNALMENLCDLLNGLNFLCIPDLMAILMALKMLLKSYLTFQLSIRLDWTVLLGPLLKLILDAIVTLLQQIAGIIVAPLDCAYAALISIANLQDELAKTAAMAAAVGARTADRAKAVKSVATGEGFPGFTDVKTNTNSRFKDVSVTSLEVDGVGESGIGSVTIPALATSERDGSEAQAAESSFSFPTGFEITSNTKLPDALKMPNFHLANPFRKMALSVLEAKNYIMDLVRKIIIALRSLEGLVSGSLGLSLSNLGLILFVKDMITLVIMIIKLFTQYGGSVEDWCEHLANNPEILEGLVPDTKSEYDSDRDKIVLTRGPEVVAEINTCATGRTNAQSTLMKKWITDLKRSGNV